MSTGRIRRAVHNLVVVALCGGALAACGGGGDADAAPRVLEVPGAFSTIQAAVDAAADGDLVLIDAGVYTESVTVDRPGIVVRGVDRNAVVLDGGDDLANGIVVRADRVGIENLTVRGYRQNGVFVNGLGDDPDVVYGLGDDVLRGYRVSYVTAYNNGLYGIYAFAARGGLIEHSYASGHPDSGFYVGQCQPCDAVVRDVVAERNAIGFYATNASEDLAIIESTFTRNRLGIAPNSQDMERLAPQRSVVIAGNLVTDNDEVDAPAIRYGFNGGGIVIGGGEDNTVLRNRVTGHSQYGIGVISLGRYTSQGNRVEANVVEDNAIDLVYDPQREPGTYEAEGNCFVDNAFATSEPAAIETVLGCGGATAAVVVGAIAATPASDGADHRTLPAPPDQPTMPDARTAPAAPVATEIPDPDLDRITVPAPPT